MDFVVNRKELSETATIPAPPLVLNEGDILVRVVKFAFTANNVSYAATGNVLGYWQFFPQQNRGDNIRVKKNATDTTKWGRIPVWGVGVVVASRCSLNGTNIHNRRVYGYFPMSEYVILRPVGMTQADFIDGMPHRRSLPAVYNQYIWCDEDPFYSPRTEDAMIVLRPLFVTSWLIVDFFLHPKQCQTKSGKPFLGANTVIISSASSKTSIGLAFLLYQYNKQQNQKKKRNQMVQIVGLTSSGNLSLVQSLDLYDQVILYDNLEQDLDASQTSCFVDMAGNIRLTSRLHQHLQQNMLYSCLVGASHVDQGGKPDSRLPGAKPTFFFAPSWTARRIKELGGVASATTSKDSNAKRRGLQVLPFYLFADEFD